ncbi:hypothetical protein F5I97DRAFT_1931232 [Phlebopus sp. FC_14]|nr:hypothetical protein F5I97DRAFT_1931232 [Phlebopus sp. FC_14]
MAQAEVVIYFKTLKTGALIFMQPTLCWKLKDEEFDLMFIGMSKQLRCFKKKTPNQQGFYYHNNKKA